MERKRKEQTEWPDVTAEELELIERHLRPLIIEMLQSK
jgi:hypothetical protein